MQMWVGVCVLPKYDWGCANLDCTSTVVIESKYYEQKKEKKSCNFQLNKNYFLKNQAANRQTLSVKTLRTDNFALANLHN